MNIFFKMLFGVILLIFTVNNSFCQNEQRLYVEFRPNCIDGNNFNGQIDIKIKNISKDTIFIVSQPFEISIVGLSKGINIYPRWRSGFNPNQIVFSLKNKNFTGARCGSAISYIKFPEIIFLLPKENIEFILFSNYEILENLKNNYWDVNFDIWYTCKHDIDSVLKLNSESIKKEFEKSLCNKNFKIIDLYYLGQMTKDTSIYFHTFFKNKNRYYEGERSIYDSILDCFYYSEDEIIYK